MKLPELKFMPSCRALVAKHLPASSPWRAISTERLAGYLADYRDRYDANSGYTYSGSSDTLIGYPRLDDAGFEALIASATDQRTLEAFFWGCLWLYQVAAWPRSLLPQAAAFVPELLARTDPQARDLLLAGNAADASLWVHMRAVACNLCTDHAACWWEEPTKPAGQDSRATTACWACQRHHNAIIEAFA